MRLVNATPGKELVWRKLAAVRLRVSYLQYALKGGYETLRCESRNGLKLNHAELQKTAAMFGLNIKDVKLPFSPRFLLRKLPLPKAGLRQNTGRRLKRNLDGAGLRGRVSGMDGWRIFRYTNAAKPYGGICA
jgi:hypothetical protein